MSAETCPEAEPDCARTGDDIALGLHCTHWFPHGEVCCNCDALLPHGWWDIRPPAPPLSFEERQVVRRFERAAHGCCDVCEGVGEMQARLPHIWPGGGSSPAPVCFPAVDRG